MFRFGSFESLVALVLIPILGAFAWYAGRRRAALLEAYGESQLVQALRASVHVGARRWKALLALVAVGLLVLALARPQFGTRVETVLREGQDLVVVLDVSRSMLAEDVTPNRLARAKIEVGRIIQRLDGDRIALVAFAGDAFVQSPLTTDYGAAMMFLNAMDTDMLDVQGTDLGLAVSKAVEALEETPDENRVLVVVTDGEDHEGGVAEAIAQATESQLTIHTVGIGTPEGVPLPEFGPGGERRGFRRDDEGNVITTALDETALQDIALQTGGGYYRIGQAGDGLGELVEQIGAGGRELESRQVTQFEEQYQLFLALALALLLVETLIPTRRRVERRQEAG
ncbi:MAG: VWA domain-containing protein [Longimicrobiales bacterium]